LWNVICFPFCNQAKPTLPLRIGASVTIAGVAKEEEMERCRRSSSSGERSYNHWTSTPRMIC
jgi:hypothetical protein